MYDSCPFISSNTYSLNTCLKYPLWVMYILLSSPSLLFSLLPSTTLRAFQVALVVKNPPANAEDVRDEGLIPGLGGSPGRGHGNPLHYSCLENPMGRGAWQAAVHRVPQSKTWLKRLIITHVPLWISSLKYSNLPCAGKTFCTQSDSNCHFCPLSGATEIKERKEGNEIEGWEKGVLQRKWKQVLVKCRW